MKKQRAAPVTAGLSLYMCVLLGACSGGGGSGGDSAPPPGGTDIAAWGDSLTYGVGAASGMSYPEQLAVILGRTVYNGGISGQTSDQIAARQGGAPALLTLPSNTLPPSGTVTVQDASTFPVSTDQPGHPITGTLRGVHGTLDAPGPQLTFARDDAGAAVAVPPQTPFLPDTFGRESKVNVFWIGGNNSYDPARVLADVGHCVDFLTTNQFIVLSLLNAPYEPAGSDAYNQKMQINASFAAAYPDHYLDIRSILVDSYDPGNAQDVADHSHDVPPSSLRNDDEHLNTQGYAIVAQRVAAFIRARGW